MDPHQAQYFVNAAVVAAELHKAMQVAQKIAITASNARALALRAGQGAAGFRAITDFIDELAAVTVRASTTINGQAVTLSRTAVEGIRADNALTRFKTVYEKAPEAEFLSSLEPALAKTKAYREKLHQKFQKVSSELAIELEELARNLRTATVLSAMSRVEASHTGGEFYGSLNVIADSVASAADQIKEHVKKSQSLFNVISI